MNYKIEKMKCLPSSTLKTIVILLMLLDHFVAGFMPYGELLTFTLRVPGRFVAPVMCYFIAEGYHYTRDKAKYFNKLLIFAIISHFPYTLFFGLPINPLEATSVMWSLAMGLLALMIAKSVRLHIVLRVVGVLVCCAFAVSSDWNYVAVLWIVFFGLFRGDKIKQLIAFVSVALIFHIIPIYYNSYANGYILRWYETFVLLAVIPILLYNGKQGRKSRFSSMFFYVFYPLHLIVLGLVRYFMFPAV